MRKLGFGSICTAVFAMALGLAPASQAEDAAPFAINCRGGCGLGTLTASDLLLNALPGGTFVITLAHLAPSPEDAFVRGQTVECRPAEFRVDMLWLNNQDGAIEVELGERQKLEPGKSMQIVHRMDQVNDNAALPSEMDQVAFRLRAQRMSPRCNLVASGALFQDASSVESVPFSLLIDDGFRRGRSLKH